MSAQPAKSPILAWFDRVLEPTDEMIRLLEEAWQDGVLLDVRENALTVASELRYARCRYEAMHRMGLRLVDEDGAELPTRVTVAGISSGPQAEADPPTPVDAPTEPEPELPSQYRRGVSATQAILAAVRLEPRRWWSVADLLVEVQNHDFNAGVRKAPKSTIRQACKRLSRADILQKRKEGRAFLYRLGVPGTSNKPPPSEPKPKPAPKSEPAPAPAAPPPPQAREVKREPSKVPLPREPAPPAPESVEAYLAAGGQITRLPPSGSEELRAMQRDVQPLDRWRGNGGKGAKGGKGA